MACTAADLAKVNEALQRVEEEIKDTVQRVDALMDADELGETCTHLMARERHLRTKKMHLLKQKEILLKVLAVEAQAREIYYDGGSLPFDSMAFDAQLTAPVKIAREDWVRCKLRSVDGGTISGMLELSRDSTFHNLSLHVMNFLINHGRGRDDALPQMISELGGFGSERSSRSSSSEAGSCLDFWLGQPPFVLGQEKPAGNNPQDAMEEIKAKFVFTPHYERVPFVIGIAIAGDLVQMGKLYRIRGWEDVQTFNLKIIVGRIRCIRAVINIGRLCRHVVEGCFLHPVRLPWNKFHVDGYRKLRISHECVEKTYLRAGIEEGWVDRLLLFYKQTARVQFLETAVESKVSNGDLELRLVPVGLERRPTSAEELKARL